MVKSSCSLSKNSWKNRKHSWATKACVLFITSVVKRTVLIKQLAEMQVTTLNNNNTASNFCFNVVSTSSYHVNNENKEHLICFKTISKSNKNLEQTENQKVILKLRLQQRGYKKREHWNENTEILSIKIPPSRACWNHYLDSYFILTVMTTETM